MKYILITIILFSVSCAQKIKHKPKQTFIQIEINDQKYLKRSELKFNRRININTQLEIPFSQRVLISGAQYSPNKLSNKQAHSYSEDIKYYILAQEFNNLIKYTLSKSVNNQPSTEVWKIQLLNNPNEKGHIDTGSTKIGIKILK